MVRPIHIFHLTISLSFKDIEDNFDIRLGLCSLYYQNYTLSNKKSSIIIIIHYQPMGIEDHLRLYLLFKGIFI